MTFPSAPNGTSLGKALQAFLSIDKTDAYQPITPEQRDLLIEQIQCKNLGVSDIVKQINNLRPASDRFLLDALHLQPDNEFTLVNIPAYDEDKFWHLAELGLSADELKIAELRYGRHEAPKLIHEIAQQLNLHETTVKNKLSHAKSCMRNAYVINTLFPGVYIREANYGTQTLYGPPHTSDACDTLDIEIPSEIEDKTLHMAGLSTRSKNLLWRKTDIKTIGELAHTPISKLINIHGMGPGIIGDINQALQNHGITRLDLADYAAKYNKHTE